MSDFYKECLVRKTLSPKERFIRSFLIGLICFVTAALAVWGLLLFSAVGRILLLADVALLVLDKFYWNKVLYKLSFCIEYEYTLTNTTLDIDKIVAKTDRTRLLSFDLKEITLMAPLAKTESREFDGTFRTVADACADLSDLNGTYCLLAETERYGSLRLTFSPDEETAALFETLLGRKFRK